MDVKVLYGKLTLSWAGVYPVDRIGSRLSRELVVQSIFRMERGDLANAKAGNEIWRLTGVTACKRAKNNNNC